MTMFGFLKKEPPAQHEADVQAGTSTHFHSTRRDSLNTQELANLALSDMLRRNSIPKDWLRVECFDVVHRPNFIETHLQLVIQRWSERLLHYSAALQQQFEAGLNHFDPDGDHSRYIVSWRYAANCEMPSALIPEGVAWHVSAPHSD
jgi:hypothetical protein